MSDEDLQGVYNFLLDLLSNHRSLFFVFPILTSSHLILLRVLQPCRLLLLLMLEESILTSLILLLSLHF